MEKQIIPLPEDQPYLAVVMTVYQDSFEEVAVQVGFWKDVANYICQRLWVDPHIADLESVLQTVNTGTVSLPSGKFAKLLIYNKKDAVCVYSGAIADDGGTPAAAKEGFRDIMRSLCGKQSTVSE